MPVKIENNILEKMSEIVALKLWSTNAVKVDFKNKFKLASGKLSPIYINCRILISDAEFCSLFVSFSRILLKDIKFDLFAGGETAGIPYASFLASDYCLPMIYVRKKPKDYGIGNLIEGNLLKGQQVLLTEDLITDAGSKIHFINEIRKAGGIISNVLVIFDRLQGGKEALKSEKINLISLCDIENVFSIGKSLGLLNNHQIEELNNYLKNSK